MKEHASKKMARKYVSNKTKRIMPITYTKENHHDLNGPFSPDAAIMNLQLTQDLTTLVQSGILQSQNLRKFQRLPKRNVNAVFEKCSDMFQCNDYSKLGKSFKQTDLVQR